MPTVAPDLPVRPLGRSGLSAPVVGLGGNAFGQSVDEDAAARIVHAALDAGIRYFDTADWYRGPLGEGERMLGRALGARRDEVLIGSKFGLDVGDANGLVTEARGSRAYVRAAVEASLRRLGTDRIDLYQYHYPDGVTPIEETLAALDELIAEGKVRAAGIANVPAWELVYDELVATRTGTCRFETLQTQYSLLHRVAETEIVPACQALGVGLIAFLPLENGLLTGKYRRGEPPPPGSRLAGDPRLADGSVFDTVERLETFAAERGVELIDVALGGLLAQPGVTMVLVGASRAEHVARNVQAALWRPDEADLAELDRIVPDRRPRRLV